MDAKSKNILLVAVAAIAIVGWAFALASGFANNSRVIDQAKEDERVRMELEQQRIEMERERLGMTVYYGFYNTGGNIPCIEAKAGETPSIEIYAENIYSPDSVVDFTLTAKRNADVSVHASDGFQQSATKRLTVLEGTQTLRESFYVKPHANVKEIQLTLEAKAIDPPNINLQWTLPSSNTIVFFNDGSENYCQG